MKPSKAGRELVAPLLTLLSAKIRERGFTELEIEESLCWEKKHIKQLTAGRKSLNVGEVLQILGAIGVEPGAFYAQLYGMPHKAEGLRAELAALSALADSLANHLVENGVVTAGELARAVAAREGKDLLPETEKRRPADGWAAEAAETPGAQAEPADAPAVEETREAVTGTDPPRSRTRP